MTFGCRDIFVVIRAVSNTIGGSLCSQEVYEEMGFLEEVLNIMKLFIIQKLIRNIGTTRNSIDHTKTAEIGLSKKNKRAMNPKRSR